MYEAIIEMMDKLDVLSSRKNPNLASAIGFLFGGVGLGIYFLSFIDFVLPFGIAVALIVLGSSFGTAEIGWLVGAIVTGLYGYFRAQSSNAKLDAHLH